MTSIVTTYRSSKPYSAALAVAAILSLSSFWIPTIIEIIKSDEGVITGWPAAARFSLPLLSVAISTLAIPPLLRASNSIIRKYIIGGIYFLICFPLLLWSIGSFIF